VGFPLLLQKRQRDDDDYDDDETTNFGGSEKSKYVQHMKKKFQRLHDKRCVNR
jgi:hypothetical protein